MNPALIRNTLNRILGRDLNRPGALFPRHMRSGQAATVVSGVVRVIDEPRMVAFQTLQPQMLHAIQLSHSCCLSFCLLIGTCPQTRF